MAVVCAECGAQYHPGHAATGDDPCGCFGAHPPKVIAVVPAEAVATDVSCKGGLSVADQYPAEVTDATDGNCGACQQTCLECRVEAERDRYRAALEILANRANWAGDPLKHHTILYGHDTPFEIAERALQRKRGEGDSTP